MKTPTRPDPRPRVMAMHPRDRMNSSSRCHSPSGAFGRGARRLGARLSGYAALLGIVTGCAAATSQPPGGTDAPAGEAAPSVAVDRTTPPVPGPTPSVDMPPVQRRALANGLEVWLIEKPGVPLVTMQLLVGAGVVAEPPAESGIALLTAAMLDEGTRSRTALELADELEFLAATLGAGAGYDASVVELSALSRTLPQALALFAEVVTQPTFPEREYERVRRERLTALIQAADQPEAVAAEQFALQLYGASHPYGRIPGGTSTALTAMTRADIEEFYRSFYRPNNSTLLVVGDVTAGELFPLLESAFSGWERADVPAAPPLAEPAPQDETRIFLVDMPGAAQSVIQIGHVAVPRNNPDYFPLLVMNHVLGGVFSSRLNLNLREDKGYTYGARTGFTARRKRGPFIATASVQTAVTKESVVEFMRELEEIRGTRPVTEEEVEFAKANLSRSEPFAMETQTQLLGRLQNLALYRLPTDYYDSFVQRIGAVTTADVNRVARQYLDPSRFAIVVVGDREAVEAGLRELPYPVELVAAEPITGPPGQ